MYTKSNAAYDFDRFAPAEEITEEKSQAQLPKKKKKLKKSNAVHPVTVIKWIFVSCFVMFSLSSVLISNVKITQLNDQITKEQKKLDAAQSVEISLDSKLESRKSVQKVDDYAVNKLGLVKITPYQVNYIHLANSDNVEINKESGIEGFFQNVWSCILEYFS